MDDRLARVAAPAGMAVALAAALAVALGGVELPAPVRFVVGFGALAPLLLLIDRPSVLGAGGLATLGCGLGFLVAEALVGPGPIDAIVRRAALGGVVVGVVAAGVRALGLRSPVRRALLLAIGWVLVEEVRAALAPTPKLAFGLAWDGPLRELAAPLGATGISLGVASVGALLGVGRWRTAAILVAALHIGGFWLRIAEMDAVGSPGLGVAIVSLPEAEPGVEAYVSASEAALGASDIGLLVWGARVRPDEWDAVRRFARDARVRVVALAGGGPASRVRDTGDPAAGGLICYEVTDSERVREVASRAAPWLVLFDGWQGPGCSAGAPNPRARRLRQAAAAIRAREWGRPVVYLAERGSSAVFGPEGSLSRVDQGYISWSERLPSERPAGLARHLGRGGGLVLLGAIAIGWMGGECVGRRRSRRARDAERAFGSSR